MPGVDLEQNEAAQPALLRALAEEAARTGGAVARDYFRRPLAVHLKNDRSEVSEADEAAQAAIVALLRRARPADAFVTEEILRWEDDAPPAPTHDRFCWVIDPIDGTRNFVRGLPHYACSVGVLSQGLPVAGAVYDPQRDVCYSATATGPLCINGTPQPPAAPRPTSYNPRPVVGIPSTASGPHADTAQHWHRTYVCRNFGSVALHLAYVAAGELDGMFADNPRLWDLAAGWVLVHAGGGLLVAPDGLPIFPRDVATYRSEELPALATTAAAATTLLPNVSVT
ncbi:MAG: inositol monophosphatase [Phycisphaerales bacterium]|nr:inositol monophosphatase [Phycisphaerales bacterium]